MFSQLLYSHRRRRALSQEDLARRAGITARSIRNLEVGSVRAPRPGTVRRLADGLALAGADRERFETAAVATYLGRPPAPGPVGESGVTHVSGAVTVQWTSDREFCVTVRGHAAPDTAGRPADLLRAALAALAAGERLTPPAPGEPVGVPRAATAVVGPAGIEAGVQQALDQLGVRDLVGEVQQ
ncbi:helix-turn-helix domain-containing protein [Virgisporangium aurantiacum]|uniref:helix-turn-helix domain-containing protein n=1 Tax=Virgisporangium aurantiacum TaxID=175570 RepID=UPI00194ED6E1|nr:helix-turn-helix transcriptional regulator [Virgisporangium aurantiacum]